MEETGNNLENVLKFECEKCGTEVFFNLEDVYLKCTVRCTKCGHKTQLEDRGKYESYSDTIKKMATQLSKLKDDLGNRTE